MKSANVVLFACLVSTLLSCKTDYQKLEKKELSSGKVENELYLGLSLGMTKKQFFDTCWKLNQEGILNNGGAELSVVYDLTMPSDKPAAMNFYPKFYQDKIYLMPIEFTYDGWVPWNEELSAENLLKDTIALFEKWYGKGFIEVANEDRTQVAFVKMDGNRRIRIFKKHISVVRAEIADLPVQKNIE
jgi:hypothetical protein